MQSAEEEAEQLALEDAKDAVALRAPASASGPPVSYGPTRRAGKDGKGQGGNQPVAQVNPFWSERTQSEALLRAMRPASLGPTEETGAASRVEPDDGGQGTFVDAQRCSGQFSLRMNQGRDRAWSIKCLQIETEYEDVDWGELQHRGARLLSQELSLLEEDTGEIVNESFLKALTVEVETVTEEAVKAGQCEEAKKVVEIEKEMEEHPAFLQTRMVGLAEVRLNLEEWKPSMKEEYGALELKVKLLSPKAIIPTRGSEQAAGLDLYSTIETMVPPGDSVLVKTGIALELPRGSYGRIAPRSLLAIMSIETAGVVDRDFRGEVKVLLRNHSDWSLRGSSSWMFNVWTSSLKQRGGREDLGIFSTRRVVSMC